MSHSAAADSDSIPYASPSTPQRRRHVVGGVALLAAGLALVLLGGCFLIGILVIYGDVNTLGDPAYWPLPLLVLPWVLYGMAFGCFGTAVWMIVAGVRWLYAVN